MKNLLIALWAEYLKVRYSIILFITIGIFVLIPIMMGFMIFIVRHPEMSAKLGLIATKASLFGVADWQAYFGILQQSVATIGLIGFGFVTAWVFGREYTERTIKDILALPVSRSLIVISKFIIVICWCIVMILGLWISGLMTGIVVGITGWTPDLFQISLNKYLITSVLTLILISPVAFFASYGRGIIAPIGFAILTLILSQFIALAGLGAYFPWAIPGLYTVSEGTQGMQVLPSSYIILSATGILGYFLTVYLWKHADQH